jgi:hypothetical protein
VDLIDRIANAIAQIESGGAANPYVARSKSSKASGKYQYLPGTWNGYGGYAEAWQAPAAVQEQRFRADTTKALARYGGDPALVAVAHFQGGGTADKIKSNPALWNKTDANGFTTRQYVEKFTTKLGTPTAPAAPAGPAVGGALQLVPIPINVGGQLWNVDAKYADRFRGFLTDAFNGGLVKGKWISSGGFNDRNIGGSKTKSNHAYGAAVDISAPDNQQGSYTGTIDTDKARALSKKWGLRWGGDYKTATVDRMHFEVVGANGEGSYPDPAATPLTGGGALAVGFAPSLPSVGDVVTGAFDPATWQRFGLQIVGVAAGAALFVFGIKAAAQ